MQVTTRGMLMSGLAALGLASASGSALAEKMVYVGYGQTEEASAGYMEEQFAKFRADHPDIDLEIIGYPWRNAYQQIVLQYQSGEAPDVAQGSTSWPTAFVALDALVDLNDLLGKDWLEANFPQAALDVGRYDGKQYSIPDTFGSIGMVANLGTLEKAGITDLPKTMDEFEEDLKKVKAAIPDSVPFAISTRNPGVMHTDFNAMVWNFGGRIIDKDGKVAVDSPEALAALKWLVQAMDDGLIGPDIQRSDARQLHSKFLTAFSFDAPQIRGFARDMSGMGADFDKNLVPMATPVTDPSITPTAPIYARIFMLFKKDTPVTKDSPAVVFLKDLMLDKDFQVGNYEYSGNFPSLKSAAAAIDDPYVSDWLKIAETAQPVDTERFDNSADLQNIIAEEYQSAILKVKTPEQAIADMSARLKAALGQ